MNQNLLYKIENLESINESSLLSSSSRNKHRAFPYSNTITNLSSFTTLNKSSNLLTKQTQTQGIFNNSKLNNLKILNGSLEMMNHDFDSSPNSNSNLNNREENSDETNNSDDHDLSINNNESSHEENMTNSSSNHLNLSILSCSNFFNISSASQTSSNANQKLNTHFLSQHSNKFNSNSNLDECSEFDDDIEININSDMDAFKVNIKKKLNRTSSLSIHKVMNFVRSQL